MKEINLVDNACMRIMEALDGESLTIGIAAVAIVASELIDHLSDDVEKKLFAERVVQTVRSAVKAENIH